MNDDLDPLTVVEFTSPVNPTMRTIRKARNTTDFLRFNLAGQSYVAYSLPPLNGWGHEVRTIAGHKVFRIGVFPNKDAFLIFRSDYQVWQLLWEMVPQQLVYYDVSDNYFIDMQYKEEPDLYDDEYYPDSDLDYETPEPSSILIHNLLDLLNPMVGEQAAQDLVQTAIDAGRRIRQEQAD